MLATASTSPTTGFMLFRVTSVTGVPTATGLVSELVAVPL